MYRKREREGACVIVSLIQQIRRYHAESSGRDRISAANYFKYRRQFHYGRRLQSRGSLCDARVRPVEYTNEMAEQVERSKAARDGTATNGDHCGAPSESIKVIPT